MIYHSKRTKAFTVLVILLLLFTMFLTSCGTSKEKEYTVQDAKTGKIGALLGSTTSLFLEEEYPDAEILQYNSMTDTLEALKTSKIDYFAGSERFLNLYAQKFEGVHTLDVRFLTAELGFAVRKGNTGLAEDINRKIAEYKANGKLDELISHWDDCNNYVIEDIPQNTTGETIVVGTTGEMEPHNFVLNEKLVGIDVEIIGNILYDLGYQVEYQKMSFGATIPALTAGKIDVIASDLSITDERKKSVDFTDPYLIQYQTFLVRDSNTAKEPDAPAKQYTEADFKGATIASIVGSFESEYISHNLDGVELLEYNTAADGLTALRSKKVDFFATQSTMLDIYERQTGDVVNIDYKICPTEAGFAVRKGNDELLSAINSKLQEYKENGRLEEYLSHWSDVNDYCIEEVPKNTTGETIVVGTTGELEPINFYVNNELVGVDIEVIGHILYDLGYQVEYDCMSFGALIPALESGKIDVIASDLYITDERKEQVDFSDVYYTDYSSFAIYDPKSSGTSVLSQIKDGLYNNLIKEARYKMILDGLKVTAALAVAAGIFGTILGILLCFMAHSRFRVLRGVKKTYSAIIEGTPMVVILLIVCYVILANVNVSGIIVGMLAFGMVFGNDVCSAIDNGLNNIDRGQYEAIAALGYPPKQGFIKIIIPQLLSNFLPLYRSSFTSMIKATAIAGYVAIQDLTKAGDIIRSRTFDAFIPLIIVAIIYFAIIWAITLIVGYIEQSDKRKRKNREVKL